MKKIIKHLGLSVFMCLLFCSCVMDNVSHLRLPRTVDMNQDAGRGNWLIVMVRLADGRQLPLAVDTGAPTTAFDKSLEQSFGKRFDTGTFWNFGVEQKDGIYAPPKLYLGNVPLQLTGTYVVTYDPQKLANPGRIPFVGLLGMDVLQNYCLQLDFAAGKIRFLDDEHADKKSWGKPFPLKDMGNGCFSINENLVGAKDLGSTIDTGCNTSGLLRPALFEQWTNQNSSIDRKAHSPDGILGGEIYHELVDLRPLDARAIENDNESLNVIGLHVLAENLVTLDFPKRMLYLKKTSESPLMDKKTTATVIAMAESTLKFLLQLKGKDQLPGFAQNAHGHAGNFAFHHDDSPYLDSATMDMVKIDDSSTYHYTVVRTSQSSPWKLQKAWSTDQNGRMTEEYRLP